MARVIPPIRPTRAEAGDRTAGGEKKKKSDDKCRKRGHGPTTTTQLTMARFRDSRGPSLPLSLLQEIGQDNHGGPQRRSRPQRGPGNNRRRADNSARRAVRSRPVRKDDSDDKDEPRRGARPTKAPKEDPKRPTSIMKRRPGPEVDESEEEEEEESGGWDGSDAFDEDSSHDDEPKVSKKVREKLAQEDKEIADLERKLGLKGKKGLPKSFKDDGLGDLLEDLDSGDSDDEKHETRKRKAEADEWLAQKRRKAAAAQSSRDHGDSDQSSDDDEGDFDLGMSDDDDDDGDGDEEDFEGFDSEPENASPPPQPKRENPYVAPTTGSTVAKYLPPSMRAQTGSDAELTSRIRRQTQGLVNRLTDANLVSILGEIEKLYREHPRQHVTSILSDLVLVQVCDPSSLPDTLLILSAGFAAAAYKVIGMDFGAYLVQNTVERFKAHYENAVGRARDHMEPTKEASNIITFLAQMYNFQMIGCTLVFDHIRKLLSELSELNAELLLRIIRMSGTALRQDDPMALKDIVAMIRPAMERTGEQNVSVRTKFMIETINDLKNNKMKAGAVASAVVAEHTTRMRKLLGSLSSRKLKATEPLRMGLKDIEESDKRGKWWLVGSSWAGATTASGRAATSNGTVKGGGQDSESESDVDLDITGEGAAPDVTVLAREQMMNTDVRRSIFVAIMSATDCEDAYHRLLKLRLNKERQREIANVLVKCAGSEKQYNPYYGLVARRLCADRRSRWAFQDTLWKLFRRLGESMFGEAAEDEDEDDEVMDMRRIVNVAKLYGWLVAEGVMGLSVLKCLSLVYLKPKTSMLVEVLLVTAMLDQQQQQQRSDDAIAKMFTVMGDGTEDLARGLQYFVRKTVRKSDLAGSKANTKLLRRRCKVAELALERGLAEGEQVAE
ncbi:hypothetical protein MAPG_03606 [Magnaporthiopsis poae ATCC 64411]|uniref:MI domain-containing protein n=1 Tax=Magnaporthiopsis poae (strain ATCC 64411 / 73-15) TaxID=644358 RepID=A0A0C4DUG6_MAGP6|nr:hypothetical protein MAPG_03606 [Magnaporthiopsis poae ATCC 64411]